MSALSDVLRQLHGRRIAVVGDVMLDHFLIGKIERISPEAPVPVVRFLRDEYRLGGAANVAHNARALGGQATLVGLVGKDDAADVVRRELREVGLEESLLVEDPTRPTTRKVRVIASRNQQVARIDYEDDDDPSDIVAAQLCDQVAVAGRDADAIVLSDYRKGVVTDRVIAAAVQAAGGRIPLLIDPKVPRAERYRGATLLTPNHHEAELMAQIKIRTPNEARQAARVIHERCGASVLITWGEHGMWLFDASDMTRGADEEGLAAAAREVADVTGAGDTVIATLALALATGARLGHAARLANLAAGLAVAKFGPAVIGPDELRGAVDAHETAHP